MHHLDHAYMARALELARLGLYTTAPNPRVGCVLVANERIVAEGWHAKAGEPHAEVLALRQVPQLKGLTAYVTLEPCSHFGKTPPCADALISAGVARVVVAQQDPNPLVAGRGLERLRQAGIAVEVGVLQAEAEALNCGFNKRMRTGLPWVRSKLAMSLDGRTALANGESQWITSPAARQDVQRLRAQSSAILTGVDTVLADDPSLNLRDIEHNPFLAAFAQKGQGMVSPVRVILDSRLRTPVNAKMLGLPGRSMILTVSSDALKIAALRQAGFEVYTLAGFKQQLDLLAVLQFLGQQQFNEILLEAGPTLNGAFLAANLLDEGIVYVAPSLLGERARGLFCLPELQHMADKKKLVWQDVRRIGPDLRISFAFNEAN